MASTHLATRLNVLKPEYVYISTMEEGMVLLLCFQMSLYHI